MRKLPCLLLLSALFCGLFPANAPADGIPVTSVVGHWFYHAKIYQGHLMPEPPDATLRMHFAYHENGESELWWWHEGNGDHCRRKGVYSLEDDKIVDQATWIDPQNTPFCGEDPDMQLGRKTRTPFYFRDGDLALRFELGDEPLDLLLKRVDNETEQKPEGK